MQQKHLFILDPIGQLNLQLDTTLRLAQVLQKNGHEIFFLHPKDLSWDSDTGLLCRELFAPDLTELSAENLAKPRSLGFQPLKSHSFTAIHLRADPPFDQRYLTLTWCLDGLRRNARRLVNDPGALRYYNEKIATFLFPKQCLPGLLTASTEEAVAYINAFCDGKAVVKPLHLFGGQGVTLIDHQKAPQHTQAALESLSAQGKEFFLVQPFQETVHRGEIRAFTAGGEAIAWCRKVPAPGNFLANTRAGARLEAYTPTAVEENVVNHVAKALLDKGVFFIGFDLIGGKISEINITSPRLLNPVPGELAPYERGAKLLENYCR